MEENSIMLLKKIL